MGTIAICMLAGGWLVVRYVENAHHEFSYEQTRNQALTLLDGLGRDLQQSPSTIDNERLRTVLDQAITGTSSELGFSVYRLLIVDQSGSDIFMGSPSRVDDSVVSHHKMMQGMSPPTKNTPQHLANRFKDGGAPLMGWDIQQSIDSDSGETFAITNLAIPITLNDGDYSLLLELDVTETVRKLEAQDNVFDRDIGLIILAVVGAVYLILWIVLSKGLIKPVSDMSVLADRISQGDLSPRVRGKYPAELGRLGVSINEMADGIDRLLKEEEAAYLQTLRSLMKALKAKDPYTAKHSARVARYSVLLGRHLGLSKDKLRLLKKGALMHDLGKIGVPDSILNKPAVLDDDEYTAMKSHPVNTAQIMAPLKRFKEFTEIAAWHHERWDGTGYPDGLSGESIPLMARIVAIADSWDAMTGDRVYRKGIPVLDALDIIKEQRNSGQWDPELVDAFIKMMDDQVLTKLGADDIPAAA